MGRLHVVPAAQGVVRGLLAPPTTPKQHPKTPLQSVNIPPQLLGYPSYGTPSLDFFQWASHTAKALAVGCFRRVHADCVRKSPRTIAFRSLAR